MADKVGFKVTISGSENQASFKIDNTSKSAKITSISISIGDVSHRYYQVYDSSTNSPGITSTLDNVGNDEVKWSFEGFKPGFFFQRSVEILSDNSSLYWDSLPYNKVIFDLNGSGDLDNAIVVVGYDDGTGLSGNVPDFAENESGGYTFSVDNNPSGNLTGTKKADFLEGTNKKDTIKGLAGNDTLIGKGENDNLQGGDGNDALLGGAGNDAIFGGAGNDNLIGEGGNDNLTGSSGKDILTGGGGKDNFIFSKFTEGVDIINDFVSADDTIKVDASNFGGKLKAGSAITAKQFVIGTAATTAQHRFIYQKSSGDLFFDRDGTGSFAKNLIANFSNEPTLSRLDIVVTA